MRTNQLAIEEIIKVICQYLVTTMMMILLAPGEKTDPIREAGRVAQQWEEDE